MDFAAPAFEAQWRAADVAVQTGEVSRSWTWGPAPWFDYQEFYKQAPNGLRQVQYFDKARMEIVSASSQARVSVTNGLLPVEMISGRVKLGDNITPDQYELRTPAAIPVAGDPAAANPDAPTYASFARVATTDNGYRDPNKVGQRTGATFGRDGAVGFRQDLAERQGTDIVAYEATTGHNVPRVFHDFIQNGPVLGLVAFGYPVTDPYWITARVGGEARDILVQIYERRVVTYTPSNPVGFQVEMGNVGQHYFTWRYPHLGDPWTTEDPVWPIFFGSNADGPTFNIHVATFYSGAAFSLSRATSDTVPFSLLRSWNRDNLTIFGHTRSDGGKQQMVRLRFSGASLERVLPSNANDYDPAVSPDGTKIVFASDRDGNAELFLHNLGSTAAPTRLTETAGCNNQHPSWLPDGSGIIYESNCLGGNVELYGARLQYTHDKRDELSVAALISPDRVQRLTNNTSDDVDPRVSPDGTQVAFTATRDGNPEIYVMDTGGGFQTRLTNHTAVDQGPTWSPVNTPDGLRLVFNSNRDGDYEVFIMNPDGSKLSQLTNNGADDGFTVWAQ